MMMPEVSRWPRAAGDMKPSAAKKMVTIAMARICESNRRERSDDKPQIHAHAARNAFFISITVNKKMQGFLKMERRLLFILS
jgi:hypothetical protein